MNNKYMGEGFLYALTPLTVYEELPFMEAVKMRKEHDRNMERVFEVVGVSTRNDWDNYYLLQTAENAERFQYEGNSGRMALTVPMRHREETVYRVGDLVDVGWSTKYKHFYIIGERRYNG